MPSQEIVPLSQPSERFRDRNADFEVGVSGFSKVLQCLGLIEKEQNLNFVPI